MNIYNNTRIILILFILFFVSALRVQAQRTEYNHPELIWRTIESEHAIVHFHDGAERVAREIAGIADHIYDPITRLYDYEPDAKVQWIVRDHDDYSNGATYYYDQKIEIWATALDFELRGQHHWLYNVVTHEFTHMIQLGASRKGPRWMPQLYFQYFGYEKNERQDVLYGYPNRIASFPIIGTVVPMWFAEGTAQFQLSGLDYEWWDSHRDMILRTRVLSSEMLTMNEMGVFGKNSYDAETVYNQGYALVRYITDIWGDDAVANITRSLRKPLNWSFDKASRDELGLSERELYREWQRDLKRDYELKTAVIRNNVVGGRILCDEGFGNIYPTFSPDGKRVAFISNKGKDYLSVGHMYIFDIELDSLIDTDCPANGPIDWSSDGRFIAYSAKKRAGIQGSYFNDIFLWDIENEKQIRLTRRARLLSPSFSHDGKQIVAVHNQSGSQNLVTLALPENIEGKDLSDTIQYRSLTDFNDGTQIFRPKFSPSGDWIVCSTSNLGTRDIYRYELASEEWKPLIATTDADERSPVFSADGRELYWADDRSGIFNLFRLDLESGTETPITNVIGGAFMPTVNSRGEVAYAEFTESGYGLRLIEEIIDVDPVVMLYIKLDKEQRRELTKPQRIESRALPYDNPFGKMMIMPRLFYDKDKLKPGFYFMTSDQLEKLGLFGSVALSPDLDRDVYLEMQYRVLWPTLYVEAYNIGRNQDQTFDDPFVIIGEEEVVIADDTVTVPIFDKYAVDYNFNLTEVDVGARAPISKGYTGSVIGRLSEYRSALHFDDGASFDYTYHKGNALILRLDADKVEPTSIMDIHPSGGWVGWFEYAYEHNRFIEGFKVDAGKGTIGEVYRNYDYHRFEANIEFYEKIFRNFVFNPRLMVGVISDSVDSFYHLYAGGLIGMRGYSFYSLGGTRKLVLRTALRFPIMTHIDRRWGPFYLDRIHGAVFAEAGDAWTDQTEIPDLQIKTDVGAELRIRLFSFYTFPTDLQIASAYGLNHFEVVENGFRSSHGWEWRHYLTLLFNFL